MARCAMFLDDLFATATVYSSGATPTLPAPNASTTLPGKVFQQWEGQDGGGAFEVTASLDNLIYINEGGGVVVVNVPATFQATASGLATYLSAAINDTGNQSGTASPLAGTYSVSYNAAARKFSIAETGGSAFTLPNLSSSAFNMLVLLLGWSASNVSGSFLYQADSQRSSSVTWLKYEQPVGETIAPNLIALMLSSVGGTDTAADTIYNDVTVYAHATDLGSPEAAWAASASLTLAVSDRPEEAENTLQGAVTSDDTGYRYWVIYWKHVDDKEYHRVNVCRAMAALSSATQTCREISDHNLNDPTDSRTLSNQHPSERKKWWSMAAELERWSSADYRAFMVAAERYGKVEGMVWALHWTDILSGALTLNSEADKGLIFYGTISGWSATAYNSSGSDRMTGSISFGQLTP